MDQESKDGNSVQMGLMRAMKQFWAGCLNGGAIYAWLGGRAFTPNFGFKPPTALRRATSEGIRRTKSDPVPFDDCTVWCRSIQTDRKIL
jgi:hypothetical protein